MMKAAVNCGQPFVAAHGQATVGAAVGERVGGGRVGARLDCTWGAKRSETIKKRRRSSDINL